MRIRLLVAREDRRAARRGGRRGPSSARSGTRARFSRLGQVARDRHHHPEDGRDERRAATRREDREQQAALAQLAACAAAGGSSGSERVGVTGESGCRAVVGAHGARSGRRRRVGRPRQGVGSRRHGARATRSERESLALALDAGPPRPRGRLPGPQRRRCAARRGPRAAARGRARGPPAAGEAGHRPDRAGHPPRPHGRAAEAARVPGPRPRRRADHRRLHRPRRRPERALGDAAVR